MQYNFFKWIDPRASKLGAILSVMVASMITHSELLSWYYCICQKERGPSADIKFPSLSEAAEATAMPYLPILVKGLLPDNCYSAERTRGAPGESSLSEAVRR